MSDYQTILTDVADKVATIWLNRPERRNAFSGEMTRELHEAFGAFEADDEVRAIVVTGAGRYFSAGADLGRGGGTFARPASAGADGAGSPADRLAPAGRANVPPPRPRSAPAEKYLPAPVTTMARTPSSASNRPKASYSSLVISPEKELRRSGWFSQIVATCSDTSVSRVW